MQIKTLAATNFKNIADARLEFSSKANCFLGDNGMGKSNLLDAIYYLSFCKSFSGLADSAVVRLGEEFMTLRGAYLRRGVDEEVTIGIQAGKRKSVRRGGKEYDRLSAHIGVFPLVMVSPADQDLVSGSGEERRRFMDQVISQADTVYLDHLIRFERALTQRNRMLRDHIVDHTLYEAVELAMARSAAYITRARQRWVNDLTAIFRPIYAAIAADGEEPRLDLKGHLTADPDSLTELLDQCRRHDEIVGHTSVGPHRDDVDLWLNNLPVRRAASQGQCKSYTVALRLAQWTFLEKSAGFKPLLLLDDIFDKLDARRVERLMEMVSGDRFGQIFITDTNRSHLDAIMERSGGEYRSWLVENGSFVPNR